MVDDQGKRGRTKMVTTCDILERLRVDPGKRTMGELLQDREYALHEIERLRADVERLRTLRVPSDSTRDQALYKRPSGTLLRLVDVCDVVGVARSTIYQWMSDGTFPKPVRLSEKAVRWRIDDIRRWCDAL